jgi:hypothetical protein
MDIRSEMEQFDLEFEAKHFFHLNVDDYLRIISIFKHIHPLDFENIYNNAIKVLKLDKDFSIFNNEQVETIINYIKNKL